MRICPDPIACRSDPLAESFVLYIFNHFFCLIFVEAENVTSPIMTRSRTSDDTVISERFLIFVIAVLQRNNKIFGKKVAG